MVRRKTKVNVENPFEDEAIEEIKAEEELAIHLKDLINRGIDKAVDELMTEGSHHRYKAMRAIAYQAFLEYLENDDFDRLVDTAIENAPKLPAGWTTQPKNQKTEKKPNRNQPAKKAEKEPDELVERIKRKRRNRRAKATV